MESAIRARLSTGGMLKIAKTLGVDDLSRSADPDGTAFSVSLVTEHASFSVKTNIGLVTDSASVYAGLFMRPV